MDDMVFPGAGFVAVFIFILLICLCCKRRHLRLQSTQSNVDQPRPQGRRHRQRNARRKWRRRRQHEVDQGQVAIIEHEAPCPVMEPGQSPYCQPPPPAQNAQYIINLNPPGQNPFQCPPGPFIPQQPHFQQQAQYPPQQPHLQQQPQYPPQQHYNVPFPQNVNFPAPNVQHQPGGFEQLYAQAQPDMSIFPQPPPPYETEPFPPLTPKRK